MTHEQETEIKGLERQVAALKQCLKTKGIETNQDLINFESLGDVFELEREVNPPTISSYPLESMDGLKEKWNQYGHIKPKEDEDDYDYARDDMNFDADRERRMK